MKASEHKKIYDNREKEWEDNFNKNSKRFRKLSNLYNQINIEHNELKNKLAKNSSLLVEISEKNSKLKSAISKSKNNSKDVKFKYEYKEKLLEEKILSLELKVKSFEKRIKVLNKDILRRDNEYENLRKSRRKFVCASWSCFKTALKGNDSFWDTYASQAEEFIGKVVHRKVIEKERKRVLRLWKKGLKKWKGVSSMTFDWSTGDRMQTFVISLGSKYGENWSGRKDLFEMTGEVRIEVKSKKDRAFFDDVNKGAWDITFYVDIDTKPVKKCFWTNVGRKCISDNKIIKKISKIVFEPDDTYWNFVKKPKAKTFKKNKFKFLSRNF